MHELGSNLPSTHIMCPNLDQRRAITQHTSSQNVAEDGKMGGVFRSHGLCDVQADDTTDATVCSAQQTWNLAEGEVAVTAQTQSSKLIVSGRLKPRTEDVTLGNVHSNQISSRGSHLCTGDTHRNARVCQA
eukprot:6470295-Amphidinium_carterae.1